MKRISPSSEEAIEATAAAWLAQRDDGLTPAEEAELTRWQQADPRHAAAVARLAATWRTLAQLRNFRPEAPRHPDRDLLAHRRTRKVIAFPRLLAAAGIAAALAVAATWWYGRQDLRDAPEWQTARYSTTIGGYERMTLSDGSVVELNASTAIRVHFTPAERRVQLIRGEAHFTVAKNKARAFWVDAGTVSVRAVGTAFDVRMDDHAVHVLVTEGRVKVDHGKKETPLLSAGERAVIPFAETLPPQVSKLDFPAIQEELSWEGPRLVFVDQPLAEVVKEFNRHNQVQIELADASLGALPVGGSFRAENVEAFVRLLAADNHIAVERPDPGRIVLRPSK